jgi:D-amino-acid dehydrogenase
MTVICEDGSMDPKHIIVVGAGIVGLACAEALLHRGYRVTVVDGDHEGDKASHGNAAGIAVTECVPASSPSVFVRAPLWLADPLGPLAVRWRHAPRLIPWLLRFSRVATAAEMRRIASALASLNARTYDDLLPMLERNALSSDLRRLGALTVYETEDGFAADRDEWALKREHGVDWRVVNGDEARAMEPALGPIVRRAVFTPQWSQVAEPKRLHLKLLGALGKRGAALVRGEARRLTSSERGAVVTLNGGDIVAGDVVVVAAGVWSRPLAASVGDRVSLESERGYNTTLPTPGVAVQREIIFAQRKFVATPIDSGLRIGGAAEFGGLDAAPNMKRADALLKLARRYLPGLNEDGGVAWSGHRPATPDSLPVIGRSPHAPRVLYAFGHGHLGLTQAATTARLIADMVDDRKPLIDLAPFAISRFA